MCHWEHLLGVLSTDDNEELSRVSRRMAQCRQDGEVSRTF